MSNSVQRGRFWVSLRLKSCTENAVGLLVHAETVPSMFSVTQILTGGQIPPVCGYNPILGYYSLSAAQIDAVQIGERTQKKLPRYPVPCFRLGRLATHSAHRNRGLGRLLMGCAVERCIEAKKHVAVALVVDAKGENDKSFYEHYGFIPCRDDPMTLYLSLGT